MKPILITLACAMYATTAMASPVACASPPNVAIAASNSTIPLVPVAQASTPAKPLPPVAKASTPPKPLAPAPAPAPAPADLKAQTVSKAVVDIGGCPQDCWNEAAALANCDPNVDDDCLCGPFFDGVTNCVSQTCDIADNLQVLDMLDTACGF
ncbi:unnamed protein product [Periconia digitata]|uniref:CFEM domain-containing protein n=1 Tax=Periconia digitata TaxID=1303443 RepID=A0A9W4XQK6_9PLEO|nr:unnamed protein product [Periconia digitata]